MPNVEHSTLTGASLHEPKGVASAPANRVYVSNGAGSGNWAQVTNSVLADSTKGFEKQFFHIQDQKANNTHGGTFTSGAWQTRTLNTVLTNEISGSLASNQFMLPAGTYYIEASAPGMQVSTHKIRLQNISDGTTTFVGTSEYSNNFASYTQSRSYVAGKFNIASTKTFEIQHRCSTTQNTHGFGQASNFGVNEVYTDVKIWKVE